MLLSHSSVKVTSIRRRQGTTHSFAFKVHRLPTGATNVKGVRLKSYKWIRNNVPEGARMFREPYHEIWNEESSGCEVHQQ